MISICKFIILFCTAKKKLKTCYKIYKHEKQIYIHNNKGHYCVRQLFRRCLNNVNVGRIEL